MSIMYFVIQQYLRASVVFPPKKYIKFTITEITCLFYAIASARRGLEGNNCHVDDIGTGKMSIIKTFL